MKITALLLCARGLRIHAVCRRASTIWRSVRATRQTAHCPWCGHRSRRVQSTHVRTVADVPVGGEPVVVRLRVRRFVCEVPALDLSRRHATKLGR